MRNLILFSFLLIISGSISAQKTIFKLWDLPKNGCSLSEKGNVVQDFSDESYAMEDSDIGPRIPKVPTGFSSLEAVVDTLSQRIAAQYQRDPEFLAPQIEWRDDLIFFRENGKWGLRKGEQNVLISPSFDHVIANKKEEGFIGYRNANCNYYSAEGKAYFSKEYLHINPNSWGSFIVRTTKGYGLVDEQDQELLAPVHKLLREMNEGARPYIHVYESSEDSYLYHLKTGNYTFYAADAYNWRFLDDRYAIVNYAALIDLQKNRTVFCGTGMRVKSVDVASKSLLISREEAPEEYYLIDYEGHFLSKQPIAEAGPQMANGARVIAMPTPYEPGKRSTLTYGLLSEKGEWIIDPRFSIMDKKLVAGRFLIVRESYHSSSLINLKGDTLLPFKTYRYFELTKDGTALKAVYDDENKTKSADLLNLETGKVTTMDDPGYWGRRPHGTCQGDTLYLANSRLGEVLIDADDNVIISEAGRIFKGPGLETYYTLKTSDQGRKRERQWLDCDGQSRTFTIGGKEIDRFHGFAILGDDFYFVNIEQQGGYFLFPDGREVYTTENWAGPNGRLGEEEYLLSGNGYKNGLITKEGEVVIPPIFETMYMDRKLGLIAYELEEDHPQYLRPDGTRLFGDLYTHVRSTGMGSFRVKRAGRWGLVNLAGEELMSTEFKYLYISNGVVVASRGSYKTQEYFDLMGQPLILGK